MYDIIIVGAGPAGLTAALYALRANKKVLILEAKNYGGQIVTANVIENYPGIPNISGFDYATNLYNQVINLGGEIKYEVVTAVRKDKSVITKKNTYNAKAVIIATGADNKKLKLENENQLIGKGISYCATCDGNFYKNKIVAVNGGGNTALGYALYLSELASKVYLIYRRDSFRGERTTVKKLETKDNISFVFNSEIVKLNGEDLLESIDIKDTDGKISNIKIDGLFIAIGHEPKNDCFKDVADLDDNGYIISRDEIRTNVKGIYVAGDTRVKKLRQLTTAVSDGSIAATIAVEEIDK